MAYNGNQHAVIVQRFENAMRAINDVVAREMAELDDIYINEAESGSNAAFVATGPYTKQELIDAITTFRAFETTRTAQLANITPFLATS